MTCRWISVWRECKEGCSPCQQKYERPVSAGGQGQSSSRITATTSSGLRGRRRRPIATHGLPYPLATVRRRLPRGAELSRAVREKQKPPYPWRLSGEGRDATPSHAARMVLASFELLCCSLHALTTIYLAMPSFCSIASTRSSSRTTSIALNVLCFTSVICPLKFSMADRISVTSSVVAIFWLSARNSCCVISASFSIVIRFCAIGPA
jgi:hypothetical protein